MTEIASCPQCGSSLPADAPEGICPRCLMLAGLQDSNSPNISPAFARTTPAGAPFVPAPPEQIALYFPQLEITGILGVGGMGTVYKARQTKLDREVALKIIRPESAQDAAFAERFNREARTLAKLNHPNIVGVHDFGEVDVPATDGLPASKFYFFLMEFVDGPNLREVVQGGRLEADQALAIIPQICDALEFAHDEGVVHRDIKPENILVDTRGRVKIADFGLAKIAERSAESFTLTGTHQVMGTPRYMAPEQMEGSRTVDRRADIFSLGVVFYELLTGELPMGQFEPPSVKAGVDSRLDEVVLRALAREPERRYQTASELKRQVDAISSVNVTGLNHESQSAYPMGASTIIEREAMAAWKWLASDSAPVSKSERPEVPAVLMILVSIAGCVACFFPWIGFSLLNAESNVGVDKQSHDQQLASAGLGPEYSICVFQDASASASTSANPTDYVASSAFGGVIDAEHHTFYGLDSSFGCLVCGCFAFLILLLVALPKRKRRKASWQLLLTLVSILALYGTLMFYGEVSRQLVKIPPASDSQQTLESASADAAIPVVMQDSHSYWDNKVAALSRVPHTLTYHPAFYGSIGLSIGMILLCATGVRHALAEEPEPAREPAQRNSSATMLPAAALGAVAAGTPRFNTPPPSEGFATSLSQEAVRQPYSAPDSLSVATERPRYSWKAILGALMVPLPMLLLVGSLTVVRSSASVPMPPGSALIVNSPQPSFLMLGVMLISGMPLILTTILGLLAISDIRNSRGRLVGLGLAFFDAVFFPTLIGNGFAFAMTVEYFGLNSSAMVLLALVVINTLGLRFLWKNAKTGIQQ